VGLAALDPPDATRGEGFVTFWEAMASGRVLLMDGGMGSELRRAGLGAGECAEGWNLRHPERVRAVHRAYVDAGAEVLLTNTFLANPVHLRRHGLARRMGEINAAGVRLARQEGAGRFVLGDVGPILRGADGAEFADRGMLADVLASLGGVDGFLFETCSSPAALAAVEYAFHRVAEAEGVPLLLSLAYHRDASGRLVTRSGHPPETYARHAEGHGVAALGVNCGKEIGMGEVIEVVQRYRAVTDLPLFARPNAGTPREAGGGLVYPRGAEEMAGRVAEVVRAGATLVGGCCGTTPAHVAAFGRVLDKVR
jgi:5-methyltetrahydrofolate--homocysteine methyltransferase